MEWRAPGGSGAGRRRPARQRWVRLAGGAALALLVLVLVVGMCAAPRVLSWGLQRVTARVIAALPPEIPAARREELRRRFDCVAAAAESGRADERRLGELVRACSEATAGGRVSAQELGRIELLAGALCASVGGALPN